LRCGNVVPLELALEVAKLQTGPLEHALLLFTQLAQLLGSTLLELLDLQLL
jgi:hypothetical protein